MSTIAALESLPEGGLTVGALKMLDRFVPGEWENITSFKAMLTSVSGLDHPFVHAALIPRATTLDGAQVATLGRALQVYQLVDRVDQVAAGAAVASKAVDALGSFFGRSEVLDRFTPKPETTQALDAGLKLVGELVAFGLVQGTPVSGQDGLARFVGALEDYARYDLMRIAAWVVFDGLLPLGPDFLGKLVHTFDQASEGLTSNPIFAQLGGSIPGENVDEKRTFILKTVKQSADYLDRFVQDRGISREKVLAEVQSTLGVAGDSLDVVAAAIDASTAYMTHTGTQTLARHLAKQSLAQLQDDIWQEWVRSRMV